MFPGITVSRNIGTEDMAYMHDFQHQTHGTAKLLLTNILVTDLFRLSLFYLPLLNKSLFIHGFLPHSSNKTCIFFSLRNMGGFLLVEATHFLQ